MVKLPEMDALTPRMNELRSLQLSLVLLASFTLSFLGLAVWFKVLCHYKWKEDPKPIAAVANAVKRSADAVKRTASRPLTKMLLLLPKLVSHMFADEKDEGESGDGEASLADMFRKMKVLVFGWSDLELQRLLQSSSAKAGLIFTVVGFLAPYVEHGDLARLLLGFVALGNQVVLFTWIYVESWGAFTNSFILTGTLTTAAFATRGSLDKCGTYHCFALGSERGFMKAMFFFILGSALLNVILAAGPLLGYFSNSPQKLHERVFKTLDDHLRFMVDRPTEASRDGQEKPVSEPLVGEIVKWCMDEKYLGEMQEKVYGGLRSTELRVVFAAVPTILLSAMGMYMKKRWLWGGAAAAALLAASLSAIVFGFVCTRQRENRLPLCFSRGIDIIESFENATADLFGMDRKDFDRATWEKPGFETSTKGFIETLGELQGGCGECLEMKWATCDFMVIQTLGLSELGHFELQAAEDVNDFNSNTALQEIPRLAKDVNGLVERRRRIQDALEKRNPVKIGPTAISKVAGVMMALQNAIVCMQAGHICTKRGHGRLVHGKHRSQV